MNVKLPFNQEASKNTTAHWAWKDYESEPMSEMWTNDSTCKLIDGILDDQIW